MSCRHRAAPWRRSTAKVSSWTHDGSRSSTAYTIPRPSRYSHPEHPTRARPRWPRTAAEEAVVLRDAAVTGDRYPRLAEPKRAAAPVLLPVDVVGLAVAVGVARPLHRVG